MPSQASYIQVIETENGDFKKWSPTITCLLRRWEWRWQIKGLKMRDIKHLLLHNEIDDVTLWCQVIHILFIV
jgi:hypothetical protein